jgi:hypothetical protein
MRRLLIATLLAFAALAVTPALAQERPRDTFESLWKKATAGDHQITEYDGYTVVKAGNAYYYFTKTGHYAHPGVVRRTLMQQGNRFFVDTEGWSFADKAGQQGFQRWVGEFKDLNRRMMKYLQEQRPGG